MDASETSADVKFVIDARGYVAKHWRVSRTTYGSRESVP